MYDPTGFDSTFGAAMRLRNRVVGVVENNLGEQYGLVAALVFFYFAEHPTEFSTENVKKHLKGIDKTQLNDKLFCGVRFGLGTSEVDSGKTVIDKCDDVTLEKIMAKVKYMTERSVPLIQQGFSSTPRLYLNTPSGPKALKGKPSS